MPRIAIRPGPWWWTPDGQEGDDRPTRYCFRDGKERELQAVVESALQGRAEFASWEVFEAFLVDIENPPEYPADDGREPKPIKVKFNEGTGKPEPEFLAELDPLDRLKGTSAIIDRMCLTVAETGNSDSGSPSTKDDPDETAPSVD